MIKKNFCYNLHNISYEINLATRFHETTCNSNIAIEVQPFGYFHTSSARYLFNFWNLTTKKNLEPSLFVVFNSITKVFFYTQFVMKKLIILNYPALNLKRQPPPPPSHHDHVCRLWRITCCTITAFKILCPLSCLYSIWWWSLNSSIYLERPRVLITK